MNPEVQPDFANAVIEAKVRALMDGYCHRWRDAGYVPLVIEQVLQADLINPATQARGRAFKLAGKLDVIARRGSAIVLIDHKTTSQDITDPNSAYWRQLAVEGQVNHYFLLAMANGYKLDSALWDVVRKPTIRPKKLTKAEAASIVSDRRYFGARVPDCECERLQADQTESPLLYGMRLTHDCVHERPEYYFQRRAVPRLSHEIMQYAEELWQHSQDMLYSRKQPGTPPRNSGACLLYGSACRYLGVCSGHDTIDSDRWGRKEFVHAELPGMTGDGRDLLTTSRIRCFQTCRAKHYYDYELGAERIDEEEREALVFGHLWHVAQEAFWTKLRETYDGDNSCSTASGVVEPATQLPE